jgi:hypothetical protein
MYRIRHLVSVVLGSLFLGLVAGPAFAGPAPLDEGEGAVVDPPAPPSSGSDPSAWLYAGYAAALAAVLLVAVVAIALDRHAHAHAPQHA